MGKKWTSVAQNDTNTYMRGEVGAMEVFPWVMSTKEIRWLHTHIEKRPFWLKVYLASKRWLVEHQFLPANLGG